jgi:hypothetical protein
MSLNPATRGSENGGAKKQFKTVSSLSADLKTAQSRIKYLEEKLAAAGISTD